MINLKRLLCGAVAVAMMMGTGAVAFAAEESSSQAEESSVSEAASESTSEAASEAESTAESTAATTDETTPAAAEGAATTEAVSNPSTGVDSTMLPLSVMGVFMLLAGGVAAVSAKRKVNEQ